ncbi:cardiolipin synthase [Paenibacillus thailandensis]|uniref:cardiolipin synthase n=1 Tax=Paenibacillus thailandensis TaxID=393250 RepID=UPI003638CD62
MNIWQDVYTGITVLNIFLAIAVIFFERRNPASSWAWLMVLFFIPILGFVLYLIVGQKFRKRKLSRLLGDRQRIIEDTIDQQRQLLAHRRFAFHDKAMSAYQDMIYMNLGSGFALYTENNEIELFTDGNSKFDALIRDIESAQHHIHLVYYIVRDDALGHRLLDALVAKAKQGVQVRFLYDYIGSIRVKRRFFKPLSDAGGLVRAFFPTRFPFINFKINYRNHRKLAIIDGHTGYIGGFNIGDEYLGLSKHFGAWRDTHMRVEGNAVHQMQAQFLMDWNLATSAKVELASELFPTITWSKGRIGMQVVASGPDTEYQEIKAAYIKMIQTKDVTNGSPREVALAGVGHIPEDRHKHGLVLDFSVSENMILGSYFKPEFGKRRLYRFQGDGRAFG